MNKINMLVLLLTAAVFSNCSTDTGMQDVTIRHQYQQAGTGSPVVVFEAGLGESLETWRSVQNEVDDFTQTISYNRAGYPGSSRAPGPREAAALVGELRELLNTRNLMPPYILVGHSLGGLLVQYYARNYPDEVAGVVLVDSTHWDSAETLNDFRSPADLRRERRIRSMQPAHVRAEADASESIQQQVRESPPLRPMPLTVLTAGVYYRQPGLTDEELESRTQAIMAMQSELATQVPDAQWIIADRSDHFIQTQQPELVTEAVRNMFEAVRD